ncbi:C-4 sterol methyl oxidase, partial [Serendipita sp. 398]
MYLWVTLRLFQAIDAHSGYDFPGWFNIFSHSGLSTSFRWWDHLFGTDDKYRAYKAKLKAAKSQGKDVRKLEEELLEQTEKEGAIAEKVAEQKQIWANGSSKVK